MLKYINVTLAVLSLSAIGFFMAVQRSCSATWFRPAGVHVLSIGLDLSTGRVDTSGQYPTSSAAGFALHIVPEFVAQAAIEPGILGLIDTITRLTVETPDGSGGWRDVSAHFFYGRPDGCPLISPGGFQRGQFNIHWYSDWPESSLTRVELREFVQRFNHTWLSGFRVSGAAFTFWLQPDSDLNANNSLTFRVCIETQSGKKWVERIDINRVLTTSECREFLQKITNGDSITLLYDTCTPRFRHFIFIDHNRRARFYESLVRFNFYESDQNDYADFLEKQANLPPADLPADLPRQWVVVHPYQNKFYAYYPSDFGNHFRVQLNEKAFVGHHMDGLELEALHSVSKPEAGVWEVLFVTGKRIKVVQVSPGSPVWRWQFSGWDRLMVPAERLRELPVLVNYCEEQKQLEFDFEE